MMRVLVCGDRNWTDKDTLFNALDVIHKEKPITSLVEGECRGADIMSKEWALKNGITVLMFLADWNIHGKSVGPIRNRLMLNTNPELVIAFHENIDASRGTTDMLRVATDRGVNTLLITGRTK